MAYDYSELVAKAKSWAKNSAEAGWIPQACAEEVIGLQSKTAETLLGQKQDRPLIVAFMGGTGVGKSSLLNRMAGSEIARTGIERPTSKEVTLYHHRSLQLQQLPENLPLEQIRVANHDDDARKHLIWMDMPDFDSTELRNKDIVMSWLPYVDLLIYVVSPERYRDNKAWRLLLAEGNKHAWVFVLNQWDRGNTVQFEDFKKQLGQAGFDDPVIFKTICTAEGQQDEFDQLKSSIESLANKNTIHQIKTRSNQVRINALKQKLNGCLENTGTDQEYKNLAEHWENRWQQTIENLQQGFEWPLQQLASHYAQNHKDPSGVKFKLWDDWAQSQLEDGLDDMTILADAKQLPLLPLKQELTDTREKAGKIITDQTQLSARQALAKPGHALHRFFLKMMRILEIVLPLAAMAGVSYQLLKGFYDSSLTHQNYLGVNFAVHSVLLIFICWLIPFYIQKKLKPSLEKSALAGLRKGLEIATAQIESEVLQALETTRKKHHTIRSQAEAIIAECSNGESETTSVKQKELERMLID